MLQNLSQISLVLDNTTVILLTLSLHQSTMSTVPIDQSPLSPPPPQK